MRDLKIEQRPTNRNEDSLYRYLNELGNHPPLSVEEEVKLAKRIHEGDEEALNRLVKANLKFVVSIAKSYLRIGVALGDLINEGNIGLIRAARTFDETKGFKFISYAVWYIRAAILASIGEHVRTIRLPMNQIKNIMEVKSHEEKLIQELQREPTYEEIARSLDLKSERVAHYYQSEYYVLSLDSPGLNEEGEAMVNYLQDPNAHHPEDQLQQPMLKAEINMLIKRLPKKEQEILKDVYGLEREYAVDFEQLGPKWGKTPTWARQMNRKAITRLQRLARPELLDYIS